MLTVDLNCDMGEGILVSAKPGTSQNYIAADELIMPYVTSANIACGFHAGDADTIRKTIELALKYNVGVGAHPGFAGKEDFGRKEQHLSEEEYYALIVEQLQVIMKIAGEFNVKLSHVKPHGALYNMSAKDAALARIVATAVKDTDNMLVLYGLSGSHSIKEAEKIGLKTASEVFADRTYQNDGSLTPRSNGNAMIVSAEQAVQQVLQMIQQQTVTTVDHLTVPTRAETICIHGDGPNAVAFAKLIHQKLKENNIDIRQKQ